jgi:hypothetical protein
MIYGRYEAEVCTLFYGYLCLMWMRIKINEDEDVGCMTCTCAIERTRKSIRGLPLIVIILIKLFNNTNN